MRHVLLSFYKLRERLPPAQSFFLPCSHTTQRKALRSFIIADGGRKFHEVSVKMILTISLFLNCIGFQKNTQISPPFLQKTGLHFCKPVCAIIKSEDNRSAQFEIIFYTDAPFLPRQSM